LWMYDGQDGSVIDCHHDYTITSSNSCNSA
jgi:hypothetical protein